MKEKGSSNPSGYPDTNTGNVLPFSHEATSLIADTLILDTLLHFSQDTIYFKDVHSRFILNNRAHLLQFGKSNPSEMCGMTDADLYPKIFADQCRKDELYVMETGVPIIDRVEQAVNAKGEVIIYSTCKYPLYNQNGGLIGTWGISRDVTQLIEAQEEVARINAKLTALALIDELSGLYNQRHFYNILKITIDQYTRKRMGGLKADFCLIYLDIDNFKTINDQYGHVTGDAVIRYVAGQLTAHTRSSDTAFRYGGDEYALILPDTTVETGRVMGERIRRVIKQNPLVKNGIEIPISVSLGIVEYHDETKPSELVEKADAMLYKAKSEGKNCLRG
ncbi:MAG TPA: GGDEF domain-containing protein [Candidatus Limiplasma sp.]|nr:GGDEF domain-containing protein [Candidatus Limiplasma sp.]HRX08025.1 GGDEF domain-containing protein [Candidatus Limiplasma sp.]